MVETEYSVDDQMVKVELLFLFVMKSWNLHQVNILFFFYSYCKHFILSGYMCSTFCMIC